MNCACGKTLSRTASHRPRTRLCRACWLASKVRYCIEECGNRISSGSSGRCRACSQRRLALNAVEARKRHAAERRLLDDEARVLRNAGNFGILATDLAREEATAGSERLAMAIRLAGQAEQVSAVTREPLTFEQQLALVASGRARVVPVVRMPQRDHGFSLVGNAAAMVAGL